MNVAYTFILANAGMLFTLGFVLTLYAPASRLLLAKDASEEAVASMRAFNVVGGMFVAFSSGLLCAIASVAKSHPGGVRAIAQGALMVAAALLYLVVVPTAAAPLNPLAVMGGLTYFAVFGAICYGIAGTPAPPVAPQAAAAAGKKAA